jgi:hypothetical protein
VIENTSVLNYPRWRCEVSLPLQVSSLLLSTGFGCATGEAGIRVLPVFIFSISIFNVYPYLRFEVFTAVTMKNVVF